jgi:phage tail-like protein
MELMQVIKAVNAVSTMATQNQLAGSHLGLATRFTVVVGGMSLGWWSSCTGLTVAIKPDQATPLGLNGCRQILMPTIEYQPIVLERAVDSVNSAALQTWLTTEITNWYTNSSATGQPYPGQTAMITLYASNLSAGPVMSWNLHGVYPTKWTGPEMSTRGGVALEKLELAHEGFLQVHV